MYKAKVIHGQKQGRKLGFPTLNLDRTDLLKKHPEGVYAVQVSIGGKIYGGLLYFGPRLIFKEKERVLEIFVLDFDREIYGETVSFRLVKYIREVKNFPDHRAFKQQLNLDVIKAREALCYNINKPL